MKSDKKFQNKVLITALSFFIPVFAIFIGLLAGSYAPFGPKNILTANGYSGFLTYYYELYDRFHDGTGLGYSNHSGLGYDFTALSAYYISDPTNLLILLFPRDCIIGTLNILYMIKIGLAGSFMSLFLMYKKDFIKPENIKPASNEQNKKDNFVIGFREIPNSSIIRFFMTFDWLVLALSISYALSLCMIGVGTNTSFTGAIALFPIIMMGIDKIINESKPKLFIFSMALSVYFNIHISIIICIFLIFYLITRDYRDYKNAVSSFLTFLISIMCSILCAAPIIICSIMGGIFTTENSLYFPLVTLDNPLNAVRQLMSQGIIAYISMYGKYDVAITVLGVFILVCYILQAGIKPISKIKNLCLILFMLSGCCVSVTRYLFNGMNLTSRNSIHYAFIVCFMFIILIYEELQYIKDLGTVKAFIAFIISAAIVLSGMFFSDSYDNSSIFITTLEFLFGYFLITIVFTSKSLTKTLFLLLTSILLMIEILIPNVKNFTNTGKYYLSQKMENVKPYQLYEAARKIHSKDKDASVLIYNSDSSYENPLTSDLSGYDYIISLSSSNPYGYLEPNKTYEIDDSSIKIKEFSSENSIKHVLFPTSITNYNYNLQNPFTSANHLSALHFNENEIFNIIDVNVEPSMAADESSVAFSVSIDDKINEGHVYFNAYYANHICDASENKQGLAMQSFPTSNDQNISYAYTGAILNYDNYKKLIDNIKNSCTTTEIDNHCFEVNSDHEGYISTGFINIPSLQFYVNGAKVKPISIINNNALVHINSGKSTIEIKYSYNGLIFGVLLAAIGIIVTFLLSNKKKLTLEKTSEFLSIFIKNNRVYIISIMLVLFIFLLCEMITSSCPFGVYSVIRDDGIAQYYSTYTSFINSIKNNNLTAVTSYDSGGFEDIIRYVIPNIMAYPYSIVTLRLAPKALYLLLFSAYYIKILLLCPISIIFYLTHRYSNPYSKNDNRLIIYSLIYSLSSYTAVFFQYFVGFRIICMLPLIILALEQLIYKKKKGFYICILSYMMIIDVYSTFLICEFLVLYFLIMEFDSFKDFISKGIRFASASIMSALLSAFSLLPFYYMTRQSPYLDTDQHNPSIFKTYVSYIKQIAEYHPCNAIKAITENDSQTASYCGIIMLFVIPLFIINKKYSTIYKIKRLLILTILFIATNNELLNYILHGFHFQTLAPNRFAIFIVFLLVCILADIKLGDYTYTKAQIFISVILPSAIIAIIYYCNLEINNITIKLSFAILSLYILATIIIIAKKQKTAKIHRLFLYITLIDIFVNAIVVFPLNIGSKSDLLTKCNTIDHLVDNHPEIKDFDVITELISDNPAYKNIGKMTQLHTLSFFDSAFTKDTMDYVAFYNIATGGNHIEYKGNPLADMMLRVKYNIVDTYQDSSYSIYPKIYQENEYELHENPYYIGLGFMTPNNDNLKNVLNNDYQNAFEYQNTITNELGNVSIYQILDCQKKEKDKKTENNEVYYTCDDPYNQVESNTTTTTYMPTTIYFPENMQGQIYVEFDGIINYAGKIDKNNHAISYDCPIKENQISNYHPNVALLDETNMDMLHQVLSKNVLEKSINSHDTITTGINCSYNGTLYLSLPYYEGWDIYIDGQKTEKSHYLGGIGISMSKGYHKIYMKYHSPYSLLGIMISLASLILIVAVKMIQIKKQ